MRLLRLDHRNGWISVDLHPLITVVDPGEPERANAVLDAVRRLSAGSTSGLRGLVQHDGLLVEIGGGERPRPESNATAASVIVAIPGSQGRGPDLLHDQLERMDRQAVADAVLVEEVRADMDLVSPMMAAGLRGGERSHFGSDTDRMRRAAVRAALERVEASATDDDRGAPEAAEVLERWERHQRRRQEHRRHLDDLAGREAMAERQVFEAARALERAQSSARPTLLSSEEEARLEALADRAGRTQRWRTSSNLSRSEASEMERLLNKADVRSWTEYTVVRTSPVVNTERLAAVEAADRQLTEACRVLDEAQAAVSNDEIARELKQEARELKRELKSLLGPDAGGDVGAALRALASPRHDPAWLAAVTALMETASSSGLLPPGISEPEKVVEWAEAWLASEPTPGPDPRPHQAGSPERDDGGAESAQDDRAGDQAAGEGPTTATGPVQRNQVARALARHQRALERINQAETAARRSARQARQLRSDLEASEKSQAPTTAAEAMRTILRSVKQLLVEVGGPLPIAVVGEFDALPVGEIRALMEALEEVAEQVQVIMVSSHPEIVAWAAEVGLSRASTAVVSTGALVA